MSKAHVTTNVNGDPYEFLCEPGETLLTVLRDELTTVEPRVVSLRTLLVLTKYALLLATLLLCFAICLLCLLCLCYALLLFP